jgi:predicted CXXCH cytochrome family protein
MLVNYILSSIVILFLMAGSLLPSNVVKKQDCLSCHGDLIKNSVVHPDLESSCDICHTSTGEGHPKSGIRGFKLSEPVPVLCFNCHSEIQKNFEKLAFVHGPVKDDVSCINCHNPHSSPEARLLKGIAGELCLKCHNKTIRKDSIVIVNISQLISKAKSVHPPVADGECVTCHNPHFSEKKFLLTANFPEGQYVKGDVSSFELCFMCHDTDLLEAKNTDSGTNFRNGNVNLHYLHINSEKGRNCTMCHDVHAALNMKMIRDNVKFGSWKMKIDFTENENGGSCVTACHSEKKYNRIKI